MKKKKSWGEIEKNPRTNKLPGSSDELAAEVNSGVDSPGSTWSNSSASSSACWQNTTISVTDSLSGHEQEKKQ